MFLMAISNCSRLIWRKTIQVLLIMKKPLTGKQMITIITLCKFIPDKFPPGMEPSSSKMSSCYQ